MTICDLDDAEPVPEPDRVPGHEPHAHGVKRVVVFLAPIRGQHLEGHHEMGHPKSHQLISCAFGDVLGVGVGVLVSVQVV